MAILNRNILHAQVFSPRGRDIDTGEVLWDIGPFYHWGTIGIGKTQIANLFARLMGFGPQDGGYVYTLIPSQTPIGKISGVPFPNEERTYFEMLPAKWVFDANAAKRAWVIIDECGDVNAAKQAGLQSLISEKLVGDAKLGGHVRIICMGNPVEVSTNPTPMSYANANRGAHIEIEFGEQELEEWCEHELTDGGMRGPVESIDADAEEARVMAVWDNVFARYRAEVVAFVRTTKKLLIVPKRGTPESSRAFVTPRSMHRLMQTMTAADPAVHGAAYEYDDDGNATLVKAGLNDSERAEMAEACVGESLAMEFFAWRRDRADVPQARDVLDGKVQWKPKASRPDITMMVLGHCAAEAKTDDEASMVFDLIAGMMDAQPDLVYDAADTLRKRGYRKVGKARDVLKTLHASGRLVKEITAALEGAA